MLNAIVVLRLLAASQVLLSAAALAWSNNPLRVRLLGCTLALAIIAYLAIPMAAAEGASPAFLGLALTSELIPLLLLALAWTVFDDTPKVPKTLACIALAYVAAAVCVTLDRESVPILVFVVQFAKLAFACAAIYVVWRGREDDLVEARLKLRPAFIVALALAVAVVVCVELVSRWRVPAPLELIGMGALFTLAFAINLAFLKLNPAFTLLAPRADSIVPAPAQTSLPTDPLIAELLRLMTAQRLYAEHGLRIAQLAQRLRVSEHQLRRAINRQLGHRNFSQFINSYRLAEAARRLVSEPRTPVLTLALDVGFRSMSSFNTAFRAQFGTVPTAYRAKSLSNS